MREIYQPAEDSYFFAEFLRKYFLKLRNLDVSYLDMGAGTGILSEVAFEFIDKRKILAVDVNPDAIKFVRKNGFNAVESNLFSKVDGKFDIISFNVPYLPKDSREPKSSMLATTGGKLGDEIAVNFLKEAMKHLNEDGKIFLLISSLTPMDNIKKFGLKVVSQKKIFFEELSILEISNSST